MSTEQVRDKINAKMAEREWSFRDVATKCDLPVSMVYRFLKGADARGKTLDKLKLATR